MKTSVSNPVLACALAMAGCLAGAALAGDNPTSDASSRPAAEGLMRADTDGDGRISKQEATAARDKKQADWFAKTDTDGDGYLTQEELRQAHATRREHRRDDMKQRMDERFKEADANSDGQLSLDEAQAKMPRLAERFTTLDADKNGLLSRDELKRAGPRGAKPQS